MHRFSYTFARPSGRLSRTVVFSPRVLFVCLTLALSLVCVAPVSAGAHALQGAEAGAGAPGLPNGRVYEQVSPTNKNGNQAGPVVASNGASPYILSGVDGDEAAFSTSGPVGESPSGYMELSVAHRGATGWRSRAAWSRGAGIQAFGNTNPVYGLAFAADMSATVFGSRDAFVPEQTEASQTPHIYMYGEDGLVQWLGKPLISDPIEVETYEVGVREPNFLGGSPDLETTYYSTQAALTPEDEVPNPSLGGISRREAIEAMNETHNSPRDEGIYEWRGGSLKAVGVLPDGHLDPYGAAPAGYFGHFGGISPQEETRNEVSDDGRVAFFLSPDPKAATFSGRPSELYVRMTAPDGSQSSSLVSRDLLLPGSGGQPAPAPGGVSGGFSFYAAPDGSQAFFASSEQLTADAPSDAEPKEYEFDTETETLTYLPGVAAYQSQLNAGILGSSRDASSFLFDEGGELDLWHGGVVSEIAAAEIPTGGALEVRATADGSVYLFQTSAAMPEFAFNNGGGKYKQVYRYETATNTLSCVSCPPIGTAPSSNAEFAPLHQGVGGAGAGITPLRRGMTKDAGRVVFQTANSLVPGDTNGVNDVYEWEAGSRSLISTGVSTSPSEVGDPSPTGNDVFFSTAEALSPGDTDGGYDVYDARVPRPGDQPPPSAVPCEGAVCQGPPSVPNLLGVPASEAFSGAGNLSPGSSAQVGPRSLTRAQKLARALKACSHVTGARKRKQCRDRARRRYGVSAASARQDGNGGIRHHNGRGK